MQNFPLAAVNDEHLDYKVIAHILIIAEVAYDVKKQRLKLTFSMFMFIILRMTERDFEGLRPAQGEQAAYRAEQTRAILAGKAQLAVDTMKSFGTTAVIAMREPLITDFKAGLEIGLGEENIAWVPAVGTLQDFDIRDKSPQADETGEEPDLAIDVLEKISLFRRQSAFSVVAFEGVDISGQSGKGSKHVVDRIRQVRDQQDQQIKNYREQQVRRGGQRHAFSKARKNQPDRSLLNRLASAFEGTAEPEQTPYEREIGFLTLSHINPEFYEAISAYASDERVIKRYVTLFNHKLVLLESGELAMLDDPEEHLGPETLAH